MGCCASAHALGEDPGDLGRLPGHSGETGAAPVERRGGGGGEGSLAPEAFAVNVHKAPGDVLGAALGNIDSGAVIFAVEEHGLLGGWNRAHPQRALRSGNIITEVNGATGYWSILEEIQRHGALAMKVSTKPPKNAGLNWSHVIEEMGQRLREHTDTSPCTFMLRLTPQDSDTKSTIFSNLPNIRAGDCGVDQCAICLADVYPDDSLVQLPCKHSFHPMCAARWLSESSKNSHGKRQCCPLCCQKVVSTPDGSITASN